MTSDKQKQNCSRFVDPEKLSDLRTKREIELMNGRPWTRELPPPPVLPPFGPLEKISGRLESFSSERFREYFDVDSYRTNPLPNVSAGQRGAGAAVAIAAGSPGVGAVMMMEGDHTDTAEYVQGSINGRPFSGWVGQTRLQAGDEVEMAVEWQEDHYQVYAITLPEERIISICPKCDMGRLAHAWWRIKNMFILTAIIMSMFLGIYIIKSASEDNVEQIGFWSLYYGPLLVLLAISIICSGLIAFSAYKAYAPTTCKLAEEIFRVFNMKNPAGINLKKKRKEHIAWLKTQGKWYPPDTEGRPSCPSPKYPISRGKWYYY
ncbi:putative type VI secretion system effector [Pantoea sp. S-LA4]